MNIRYKKLSMTNQNSTAPEKYTPESLIEKYGIKTAAYYERLKFLGIKAKKDSQNKAYLDAEQVELLDELHEHIISTGKMEGFSGGGQLAIAPKYKSPQKRVGNRGRYFL